MFSSGEIKLPLDDDLESVCGKAHTKAQNIFIYNAYIPPNSNGELYSKHFNAIKSMTTISNDLIVGDLNLTFCLMVIFLSVFTTN